MSRWPRNHFSQPDQSYAGSSSSRADSTSTKSLGAGITASIDQIVGAVWLCRDWFFLTKRRIHDAGAVGTARVCARSAAPGNGLYLHDPTEAQQFAKSNCNSLSITRRARFESPKRSIKSYAVPSTSTG